MDTDTASYGHRNEHGCGSTLSVSHRHGRTIFEINADMYRVLNVYEH